MKYKLKKNAAAPRGSAAIPCGAHLPRAISMLCAAALCCALLCGCGPSDNRPTLSVWVYSNEYKTQIEQAFDRDLTSVSWRLDISVVGSDELDSRLETAENAGSPPDIFMLSPDNLRKYANSRQTLDMAELGISLSPTSYYDYTIKAAEDNSGALKAVCWQADPGLFFYRRSIAKAYLGTDSPDDVGSLLSNWNSFLETARVIHERSGGRTYMTVGAEDMMRAYLGTDTDGWIKDGRLNMSNTAASFLDYFKTLADEELVYEAEQWSASWVAGMSDPQSVFGYFSSGLGMKNILKKTCGGTISGEGSYGDWACVEGPSPYNWGGCWLAVNSSSSMKKQAAVLLEYMMREEEAMQRNCLLDGIFSSNRTVVETIKYDSQFSDPFLSFQNYYSMQAQAAGKINLDRLSEYSPVIDSAFAGCVYAFAFEGQSRDEAVADFVKKVQTAYPELV